MNFSKVISASRLDVASCGTETRNAVGVIIHALRIPGCRLLLLHRLQQEIGNSNFIARIMASFLWNLGYILTGCNIGRNAKIAGGVVFPHPVGIVIGNGCVISKDCWIYQNVTIGATHRSGILAYPRILDSCHISPGACILGGITLEPGTRVGANAVLYISTDAGALYVGAPAHKVEKS